MDGRPFRPTGLIRSEPRRIGISVLIGKLVSGPSVSLLISDFTMTNGNHRF